MLADHLDGILNYCRTKVRFGVVEAINGNSKTLRRAAATKSRLPTAQGAAHGGHKNRIYRSSESSLTAGPVEFLRRAH